VIDPNATEFHSVGRATVLREKAGVAIPRLVESLVSEI
jgi:hypothetical protein